MLDGAADLVVQAQQGDSRAYATLYEHFSPGVFRFLRSRLNGAEEIAEDLTSTVFVKIWEKLSFYVDRGLPFEAWVFQVTRNCLVDYLRRESRNATDSLDLAAEVAAQNTDREYAQVLDRDIISGALAQLGAIQRQTIRLRFLEGRSLIETAALMGRTDDAIKKLQSRGLANLRRLLTTTSVRIANVPVSLAAA